jgi:hypothetical protein
MMGNLRMLSIAKRIVVLAAALIFSNLAMAQSAPPPHVQVQETIGAAQPQVVSSLIVFSSKGATMQPGKLVLAGVAPNAIVLADRPTFP